MSNWPPLPEIRDPLKIDGQEVNPDFSERIVARRGMSVPDDVELWFGSGPDWRMRWDSAADALRVFYHPSSGTGTLEIFGNSSSTVDVKLTDGNLEVDGTYLKLPVKTTTGDPSSPAEGWMYVNTFDNKVRVYADGVWRDLATW